MSKKMLTVYFAALFFVGTAVLPLNAEAATKHLSVVTGPVGGPMYAISGVWVDIINKTVPGVQMTNQVGGGSAYTARVLGNGEADFALAGNDIAFYASKGENIFKDNAIPEVRSVGALYAESFHVVTAKNANIARFEDLRGKKTSIGPPGSGTLLNSERVIDAYGYQKKDIGAQELGFNESAESLKDNHIDAACYMTGIPYGPIMDVAITKPIAVLGLNDKVIADLVAKYPFFVKTRIPAGTYEKTDGFDTISVKMLILTTTAMDEETVYKLTKALAENVDQIQQSHASGRGISKETILEGLSVPLHPGAERYYREAGILK